MATKANVIDENDLDGIVDEYGDRWSVVADDGNGHYAVERDTGARWEAGEFVVNRDHDGGEIYPAREDATFGVSCQDEFIVRRVDNAGSLRWVENA